MQPQTLARRFLSDLPVTERHIEAGGVSTTVVEGGAGPPLVLLHGPCAYAAHWIWVIPELVRAHRVIAPDLPDHGSSRVHEGPLDEQRVLAWLRELLEQTCTTPPVIVGHLAGGAIAMRFALAQGDRVARLVLVDTFGLAAFQLPPQFEHALMQFLAGPGEETHDNLWRYCAFDAKGLQRRMGERWRDFTACNVEYARRPETQAAVTALIGQFGMQAIPPAELERITHPTTLIWGKHDLGTPLSVAQAASARYGWPLHVIEGAADDPAVERPQEFLQAFNKGVS